MPTPVTLLDEFREFQKKWKGGKMELQAEYKQVFKQDRYDLTVHDMELDPPKIHDYDDLLRSARELEEKVINYLENECFPVCNALVEYEKDYPADYKALRYGLAKMLEREILERW